MPPFRVTFRIGNITVSLYFLLPVVSTIDVPTGKFRNLMKRRYQKLMISLFLTFASLFVIGYVFIQQPKFGRLPEGSRLESIKKSPHYIDGRFQNLVPTPQVTEGSSFAGMLWDYLFIPKERLRPSSMLPSEKINLTTLDKDRDTLVWLGHSSFFMQLSGKRILVDPVFSTHASPFFFSTRAFEGTSPYLAEDIPDIDYLIISHDHWDHLDYPTLSALRPRIRNVICGLGVGAHLEHWQFPLEIIHEVDWFTTLEPEKDFTVHVLPARHFSGRWLTRNQSLWVSFVIETPQRRIFYSGDGGYGPHIREIGEKFGGFDLAIMENGQYDKSWKYIHMMPEEVAKATEELQAKVLLPVHSGKFSIANHSWDDPFKRIAEASRDKTFRLKTPMIGEQMWFDDPDQTFSRWWEGIE